MKKFYILLIAMFLVNGACQRSQFATTTRHSGNGKITYINHYPAERSKSSKVKYHKNHLNETTTQNNCPAPDRSGVGNLPEPEITTFNPAQISENKNLIASTSNEPIIIAKRETKMIFNNDQVLLQKIPDRMNSVNTNHLIIRSKGHKTAITRANVVNKEKIERNGLIGFIFSVLGCIPVIGIPFAILGIIFCAISLYKFKNDQTYYRGKGFAIAGLIIGIIVLLFSIILSIYFLSNFPFLSGMSLNMGGF